MLKTGWAYLKTHPRQNALWGWLGMFIVLLILFVINERNWRPLPGKALYFELTDDTLAKLRAEELPTALLTKLAEFKGQRYPSAETLLHAVQVTLDQDAPAQTKAQILRFARQTTWRATSNYSQEMAADAVDGSFKTHWSSYAPMTFGMYFHVDLGAPVVLNGLVLQVSKQEQGQPAKWLVKTSSDGKNWQTIIPRPHFTAGPMLVIPFAAVPARFIEIMQTSVAAAAPWLIYELDLLQPIVPWQFDRMTFIFWLSAYVFTLISVLPIVFGRVSSRQNALALILLTELILAGGWAVFKFEQAARHEKNLIPLIETIRTDPRDCKRVAILEKQLAQRYPALAALQPDTIEFAELQRFAEQGMFWTYLVTALNPNENAALTDFLDRYYTLSWQNFPPTSPRPSPDRGGREGEVGLYVLRDIRPAPRPRFIWRDLFMGTGHHLEDPESATGVVRIGTETEKPGLLTFGPFYPVCTSGRHIARFALRSNGKNDEVAAILEVVANTYDSLARLELKGTDFPDAAAYQVFDVPFELDLTTDPAFQMKQLQFIVHFTGNAEVRVDYIELIPPAISP